MGWSAEEHWPRDPGGVGQQRRFRRVMGLPVGGESGRRQPATRRAEAMAKFEALRDTGYRGPIEVEVFHDELWSRPGPEILAATVAAFRTAYAQQEV